jgi:hypothetical protein
MKSSDVPIAAYGEVYRMDRSRLISEITAAEISPHEVVYVERRGDDYRWTRLGPASPAVQPSNPAPDAWIFYSGPWPSGRPAELPAFAEDLLAEMESMTGGADRCRWPLDQPYPHWH